MIHSPTIEHISFLKMSDLENAFQGQIALYPFMASDIGLYQPRSISHIGVCPCSLLGCSDGIDSHFNIIR